MVCCCPSAAVGTRSTFMMIYCLSQRHSRRRIVLESGHRRVQTTRGNRCHPQARSSVSFEIRFWTQPTAQERQRVHNRVSSLHVGACRTRWSMLPFFAQCIVGFAAAMYAPEHCATLQRSRLTSPKRCAH